MGKPPPVGEGCGECAAGPGGRPTERPARAAQREGPPPGFGSGPVVQRLSCLSGPFSGTVIPRPLRSTIQHQRVEWQGKVRDEKFEESTSPRPGSRAGEPQRPARSSPLYSATFSGRKVFCPLPGAPQVEARRDAFNPAASCIPRAELIRSCPPGDARRPSVVSRPAGQARPEEGMAMTLPIRTRQARRAERLVRVSGAAAVLLSPRRRERLRGVV